MLTLSQQVQGDSSISYLHSSHLLRRTLKLFQPDQVARLQLGVVRPLLIQELLKGGYQLQVGCRRDIVMPAQVSQKCFALFLHPAAP
jgi:hypothetical protein